MCNVYVVVFITAALKGGIVAENIVLRKQPKSTLNATYVKALVGKRPRVKAGPI